MRLSPTIAFLLIASAAAAQECDTANATQTDLNLCYGAAFDTADAELNRLYGQVRGRLGEDAATKGLLTGAQRAWIAYRDAECDFEASSVIGGSVYPMIRALCLTSLTTARSAEFKGFLACEEGDLSCPLPPG